MAQRSGANVVAMESRLAADARCPDRVEGRKEFTYGHVCGSDRIDHRTEGRWHSGEEAGDEKAVK